MPGHPSSELERVEASTADTAAVTPGTVVSTDLGVTRRAEPVPLPASPGTVVTMELGVAGRAEPVPLPASLGVTPGFRRRVRHNGTPQAMMLRPGTFEAMPLPLACALLLAMLGVVFVADRATQAAPLQHLYYIPIIVAAIRLGWPGGLGAGFAAVVLYHLANPRVLTLRYEESDVVQIALFLAVGVTAAKLAGDAQRLRLLAVTDDLTGLHNLRSFEVRFHALLAATQGQLGERSWAARVVRVSLERASENRPLDSSRTQRDSWSNARPGLIHSLSVLVLDVDRLKSINDAHGHLAGADAVRTVGSIIALRAPTDAIACRYGGDEFVIALPACDEQRAGAVADELRRAVHACTPELAGMTFPQGTLSISIGTASYDFAAQAARVRPEAPEALSEALFRAADAALYAAKEKGRNSVAVARPFPIG